jgi:hypothetical protein
MNKYYVHFDIDLRYFAVRDQDDNLIKGCNIGYTMYEGKTDQILETWGFKRSGGWIDHSEKVELAEVVPV